MKLRDQPWLETAETTAVFDALEAAGGPGCARFVGGSVRNAVMGLAIDDLDVATTLTPERTMEALKRAGLRAVPTGIEHGTVTAVANGTPYEVTTLRRDVETDGRRAVVAFTDDWAEDAARRDFRLNALYCDRAGTVFDPTGGGIDDALAGRVVFVGDAETRIREDYLRILRFFRFFAWYGRGEPDGTALDACARLKEGIARLSAERVGRELLKLLGAPDPRAAVRLMDETGVLREALPFALGRLRFERIAEADALLRLSALLPDDTAAVLKVAERLRLSRVERDRLCAAVPDDVPVSLDLTDAEARVAIYRLGAAVFSDRIRKLAAAWPEDEKRAPALLDLSLRWTRPTFPLGGADVAALGVPHGPETGELLRAVESWWTSRDFPDSGLLEQLADLARGQSDGGSSR